MAATQSRPDEIPLALPLVLISRDDAFDHLIRARELIENLDPSRAKAYVTSRFSRHLSWAGDYDDAIRLGREALAMAERLGLDELCAQALNTIGGARVAAGDRGGVQDLERSVAIAVAANAPAEICRGLGNLGATIACLGQLTQGAALREEAAVAARRFGQTDRHESLVPGDRLDGRVRARQVGRRAVKRKRVPRGS